MKKTKFEEAVEYNLKGIDHISPGICSTCGDCTFRFNLEGLTEEEIEERLSNEDILDEGGCSSFSCDSCGSGLQGDRYCAHGLTKDNEIIHLDICQDCLCYHANGDIPEEWS